MKSGVEIKNRTTAICGHLDQIRTGTDSGALIRFKRRSFIPPYCLTEQCGYLI